MIGVFDSGSGGLSVLKEIIKILPDEKYVYFADNAFCPYGEKSPAFIQDRARHITEFLIGKGADIIVVACNTATAAAISLLRDEYSDKDRLQVRERVGSLSNGRIDHIKFIGMEPAVKPAALGTKKGVIGVLATAGTLKASKYLINREKYEDNVIIAEQVGKGFVELVENGELTGEKAERIVRESLQPLLDSGADTIVLGCTHYPFLLDTLKKIAGDGVNFIDPAPAVARHLLEVMEQEGINREQRSGALPEIELVSSGDPSSMHRIFRLIR